LLSLTANNLNVSILEDQWPSIFARIEASAKPRGYFLLCLGKRVGNLFGDSWLIVLTPHRCRSDIGANHTCSAIYLVKKGCLQFLHWRSMGQQTAVDVS